MDQSGVIFPLSPTQDSLMNDAYLCRQLLLWMRIYLICCCFYTKSRQAINLISFAFLCYSKLCHESKMLYLFSPTSLLSLFFLFLTLYKKVIVMKHDYSVAQLLPAVRFSARSARRRLSVGLQRSSWVLEPSQIPKSSSTKHYSTVKCTVERQKKSFCHPHNVYRTMYPFRRISCTLVAHSEKGQGHCSL